MKRTASIVYGAICLLLLVGGFLGAFYAFWLHGLSAIFLGLVCIFFGFVFAPTVHELGHVVFARANGMKIAYVKFFCFRWVREDSRLRFSFANPFSSDETQVVPAYGGNMNQRAKAYTLGGLIFNGIFLALCVTLALLVPNAVYLWGLVPSTAYILILNVLPADYPAGLTDMAVFLGICKNEPAQQNLLSAMEIQGRIFAGESYGEVHESLYVDVPVLAEDDPLFAVMLDLRYRYYLENEELEKASECLNRLAMLQPYLSERETERVAGELVYMHALNGDYARAVECAKLCEDYLSRPELSARRILCAYTYAFGDREKANALQQLALEYVDSTWLRGHGKWERKLLLRMNKTDV